MATFHSLPPELLLPILTPLPESSLVLCASVNRNWNAFATPLLYRRVAVYSWHCNAKTRAASLMRTLAERSEVARWVKHIDVRDFYRDFEFHLAQEEDRDAVFEHCEQGLANCVNLESCIWPRHRTLTTQMLVVLASLPRLQRLEINAHSGTYEPADLIRVRQIRALGLTMPDKAAVDVLLRWFMAICVERVEEEQETEIGLRELKIICQSTNYVGCKQLTTLAPYLTQLESFHLLGCPKADHIGVDTVIRGCSSRLEDLSLESISPNFDLKELATGLALPRLKSLTLTLPAPPSPHLKFLDAILELTADSPLVALTLSLPATLSPLSTSLVLYSPTAAAQNTAPKAPSYPEFSSSFARSLATKHAQTLRKVAIARLPTPLGAVEILATYCPKLEVLIVPVHEFDWPRLGEAISAASLPFLRTLHLSYPTSPRIRAFTKHELMPLSGLRELAETCSCTLEQIGQLSKVYEVVRRWDRETDTTPVVLERWTGPIFPEAFQVIRA
ncbi:hypothetical protein DACRYDRAFT_116466 [Dacryopinax primogenitus]|uniref:F-box domain-containing protein n=1 Tax=Dacryopinax primogenitus (strain DJM 731) TaxID=1858805 RepID=M5FU79_DACPD|nr:uncharacterized protein DACRYDRAFT_116466 [Dacryopinax primogenitus]EJU01256.1 hypothetical protein DACRYDRAFT_116466 [Dacryopinax primogenitus]